MKLNMNGLNCATPKVMKLRWSKSLILLSLSGLILSGCNDNDSPVQRTAVVSTELVTEANPIGEGSGGGGFADVYALEELDRAKSILAQIITDTSEEVFAKLPEKKGKSWLINVVEGIEYRNVDVSRYGRSLKFNYDLESETVYATRHFSRVFPYGRSSTRKADERFRVTTDVLLDILHEISHLYAIGNTEQTDSKSEDWAVGMLTDKLAEEYVCDDGKTVMILNPATGMSYINRNVKAKQKIAARYEYAEKSGWSLRVGVGEGLEQYSVKWSSHVGQYERLYAKYKKEDRSSDYLSNSYDLTNILAHGEPEEEQRHVNPISFLPVFIEDEIIFSNTGLYPVSWNAESTFSHDKLIINKTTLKATFKTGLIAPPEGVEETPTLSLSNYKAFALGEMKMVHDEKEYQCKHFVRPIEIDSYL